jgi:hypothetical protein
LLDDGLAQHGAGFSSHRHSRRRFFIGLGDDSEQEFEFGLGLILVSDYGKLSTIGGSMGLLSRKIRDERSLDVTVSGGSFSTKLFDASFNSGRFGPGGKSSRSPTLTPSPA